MKFMIQNQTNVPSIGCNPWQSEPIDPVRVLLEDLGLVMAMQFSVP